MGFFSFFSKEKKETLDKGLSKTKESVFSKIARAVAGKSKVDDEVLDNLEEVLITSDVGVETTLNIIKRIEKRAAADKYVNTQELNHILRDEIAALLTENNSDDVADFDVPIERKPYVIMVVGVNGVGKTTTIGKLAYQFKKAGKSVYLGAADTFRAAAVEQLMIWGERVGVPVVKQKMGADPASVAYDTLSSAVANNAQVQGVTVFFSTAAKRPQFILQLPVIVTISRCQIVTAGIDKRRTAVDTEGLGPADSVQNIIKTAQTIIHQTVAYS